MKKENLLFVYGSLKRGHSNHERLIKYGCEFIEEVETSEGFKLYFYHRGMSGIATMVRASYGVVMGELYRVPDIEPLNRFEGHPYFYRLEPIIIKNEVGVEREVGSYLFQDIKSLNIKTADLITDGNYIERNWIFNNKSF